MTTYYRWPDGSYCEKSEYNEHEWVFAGDYEVIPVSKYDVCGEPIWPSDQNFNACTRGESDLLKKN